MNLNIVDYVSNVNYILKIILPNKKDDLSFVLAYLSDKSFR